MSSDSSADNSSDINLFKNLRRLNGNHGYLICPKCYGYYPLKENELPEDFLECECGNSLEFYENIDNFLETKGLKGLDRVKSEISHDKESPEIADIFKSKSEKRKEFFKELSMRIKVQEDLLSGINYEEGQLWDTLEEKSLNSTDKEIAAANIVIQEDNFLSHVKKQRSRVEHMEGQYIVQISAVLFAGAAVMLLILFLTT
jgi:hypothetical protein